MAHSPAPVTKDAMVRNRTANRRRRARSLPSSITLAVWRLRQTWRLLLIAGLGNIAAVLIVCIVPLFTQVALSAGLQSVLTGPSDATQIVVNGFGTPTAQDAAAIQQQLDRIVASDMGAYVKPGEPLFSIMLPDLFIVPDGGSNPGSGTGAPAGGQAQLQIYGADMTQAAQQYTIVAGRLPAASSTDLEVALSQSDAAALNALVGSVLHAQVQGQPKAQGQGQGQGQLPSLALRVVGIFLTPASGATPNRSFTDGPIFGPSRMLGGSYSDPNSYTALASNQTIFAALAASGLTTQSQQEYGPPPSLGPV